MSKSVGAGLAYGLHACSVCATKAPLQLQLRLVVLYKCYMPLALHATSSIVPFPFPVYSSFLQTSFHRL